MFVCVCVRVSVWRKKESNQTDGYQWFLFHGFDVYGWTLFSFSFLVKLNVIPFFNEDLWCWLQNVRHSDPPRSDLVLKKTMSGSSKTILCTIRMFTGDCKVAALKFIVPMKNESSISRCKKLSEVLNDTQTHWKVPLETLRSSSLSGSSACLFEHALTAPY